MFTHFLFGMVVATLIILYCISEDEKKKIKKTHETGDKLLQQQLSSKIESLNKKSLSGDLLKVKA